jgi:hypothetical protein
MENTGRSWWRFNVNKCIITLILKLQLTYDIRIIY